MSGKKRKKKSSASSLYSKHFTEEERKKALEMMAKGIKHREVAKAIGSSTETLRLWKRRAEREEGASGKSKKDDPSKLPPALSPGGLSGVEQKAILEIKKRHPSMGPAQVQAQLRRFKGWQLSRRAIARVFKDGGYELVHVASRPQGQEHPRRFEAPRRNVLWQMDLADMRVGPEKRALVLIEDDFSRFIVGWGVFEFPTGERMVEVLVEAIARHGKPDAIYTDRGGVFLDWGKETSFQRFLAEQLIDHVVGKPYHPQGRGKVEALIKSIRRELWDVRHFESWDEALCALERWFHEYNHRRAHMGIDGLTPADRFFGRWEQVRAMLEAAARGRLSAGGEDGQLFEENSQGCSVEALRLLVVDDRLEIRLFGHRIVLGKLER